jgi:hypothetical protein
MNFCHRLEEADLKKHPGKTLTKEQEDAICLSVWNKFQHHGRI